MTIAFFHFGAIYLGAIHVIRQVLLQTIHFARFFFAWGSAASFHAHPIVQHRQMSLGANASDFTCE